MFVRPAILLVSCLAFLANGCQSKSVNTQNANNMSSPANTSSPATSPGGPNACLLIENSEIAAVQGAQVQSTTPSNQVNGAIAISQCYYTVTSTEGAKNLSVHLQVMKADPKDPGAVTAYWEKAFHEKKGKKKKGPPQAVAGVGEEAFWIDSGKTGVLYALQKKSLVRVSIGGQDSKNRLEKSKTLMAKALQRVS